MSPAIAIGSCQKNKIDARFLHQSFLVKKSIAVIICVYCSLKLDIDEFDISEHPYKQLLVWNPEDKEIVGAYRFILCKDAEYKDGEVKLATTELFHFSEKFMKEYLPYTIELGRSFIQPDYQPSEQFRKGLFSLDNLWDGLGAIIVDYPEMRYFFGKVTMYTDFNAQARDMILAFMAYYFPDKDKLVEPVTELKLGYKTNVDQFIKSLEGLNYKDGPRRSMAATLPRRGAASTSES